MLSRAVAGMLVMALALAGGAAFADTTWSGTTSTDFEVGTNWVGGSAPADDTTTDVAVLSGGVPGNQPELSKSRSVKGLNFLSGGWDIFSSAGTVHTLSLGSYGVRNDPSGTNVVGDKAVLSISDADTMMQTDNGYLDVKAKITGSGGLKFYGLRGDGNQRYMHLRGDNDFTGASNLTRSAWVRLYHANALGTAANTITVQGQSGYRREARLYLAGSAGGLNANKSISVGNHGQFHHDQGITLDNTITLSGGMYAMWNHDGSGDRYHTGSIALTGGTTSTIYASRDRGKWYQTGVISGDGGLRMYGYDSNRARLYFRGDNTYTGGTRLEMSGWGAGGKIYAKSDTAFGTGPVELYHANNYLGNAWTNLMLEDNLTMDNEFTGTGAIDTGSYVLTTTGALSPEDVGYGSAYATAYSLGLIDIEDLKFGTNSDGCDYNWDYGYVNTADSGDPPAYEFKQDLVETNTLAFGTATHTLNVSWIDESGGSYPDPLAGDYVLFTYGGTDPDELAMSWILNLPPGMAGGLWVDEANDKVMLTLELPPVPEPAGLSLLGLALLGLKRKRRS